jgi:DNA processing protein
LYGLQLTERLAGELAVRGVTVVSGLARGIDAAAHRGALRAGGRTLAVIGSGLGALYPPEHAELAEQIAARGAVFSEFPITFPPIPGNFPRRNRLISGLSLGVVVVEAARRSGSLITADCALEQGREVFAVPGRIDSTGSHGTHALLKQGARLVTGVDDILEALHLELARALPPMPRPEVRADVERLLDCFGTRAPIDVDRLAQRAGLPVATCGALLTQLELQRRVRQLPGKRFVRI